MPRDVPEIERFECMGGIMEPTVVDEQVRGTWTRFADHQQIVAAKDERIAELEQERDLLQKRLDGLKLINQLSHDHNRKEAQP